MSTDPRPADAGATQPLSDLFLRWLADYTARFGSPTRNERYVADSAAAFVYSELQQRRQAQAGVVTPAREAVIEPAANQLQGPAGGARGEADARERDSGSPQSTGTSYVEAALNQSPSAAPDRPTRECDQCGAKDWPEWQSDRCPGFPYGSCDGTLRPIPPARTEDRA
jgi:hypothetical protein